MSIYSRRKGKLKNNLCEGMNLNKRDKKICRLYLKGLSRKEIGSDVGLSPTGVYRVLRKYKISKPRGYHLKGKRSQNWRGGRNKTIYGYYEVYAPDHPFIQKSGYVKEHRLVVEKKIGRFLLPSEIVHHKNGIKDDNRINNLEIISKSAHVKLHHLGKKVSPQTRKIIAENSKKQYKYRRINKKGQFMSGKII